MKVTLPCRSNTFPNAMEPPLYQEQQAQAQQYYRYGYMPQNQNQDSFRDGNYKLPPVQDCYDTFR